MNAEETHTSLRLSWEQRPFRALINLAWPICVSMLGYSVMQVIDTFFVGRLGAAALAAVALGSTLNFALIVFSIGMLRGVKVVVSQAQGAGDLGLAKEYWFAGILLGGFAGVVTTFGGQLLANVVPSLAHSAEAGALAQRFLRLLTFGAPIWLMATGLREGRYGLGDTRGPMLATLCEAAVKIVCDYVFIIVLGYGVPGAAAATLCAITTGFAVLCWWSAPAIVFRTSWRRLRVLVNVGLPTGLQFVIEFGAFALLSIMISRMSAIDMAAHQIALQCIHFSFLPALAVGEALSVFAGQAVGAGAPELVRRLALKGVALVLAYTGLCTIVTAIAAGHIAGAFTLDATVAAKATSLLFLGLAFQMTDGAAIVARSVLRGSGDVRFPAAIGILIAWCATPPLCWLFGMHWGWGALGGWLGLTVEIGVNAIVMWWRLWGGNWRAASEHTRKQAVFH
jgi:MATE family multidrug resistance protein